MKNQPWYFVLLITAFGLMGDYFHQYAPTFKAIKVKQSLALREPASTQQNFFENVANVATSACGDSYSQVDDCFNHSNPPRPSIDRSLEVTSREFALNSNLSPFKRPIDNETVHFPTFHFKANKHQMLPYNRTSNDGRLVLTQTNDFSLGIGVFKPEELNYDLKTKNTTNFSNLTVLNGLIYQNPVMSRLRYDIYGDWQEPTKYHFNLCDDSGLSNNSSVPRKCQARMGENDPLIDGDCYDVTIMAGLEQSYSIIQIKQPSKWELRSVPVTAFVPYAKTKFASNPWIYPRKVQPILPPYVRYNNFDGQVPSRLASAQKCYPPNQPNKPNYCEFLYNQSASTKDYFMDMNGNNSVDAGELWDGSHCDGANNNSFRCRQLFFFEQSTTDDGKLLIINAGPGLMYSFNKNGSCKAQDFSHFKPISSMVVDPDIYQRYDIAKSMRRGNSFMPFRDSRGMPINPGVPFKAAYSWIDRKGKNIFFSMVNAARDGYFAEGVFPDYGHEYPHIQNNPDLNAAKAHSVMGTWTQGKVVVLDNGFNVTDFGGYAKWIDVGQNKMAPVRYRYDMNLYQGSPISIRPKGTVTSLSFENVFNEYDALSPILPFDVVWSMGSDVGRNTEVVFDEYHMPNAFIVAHMNAPLIQLGSQGEYYFQDGFLADDYNQNPRYGGEPGFKFRTSPHLQNAATAHTFFNSNSFTPPTSLQLKGGARVEPVNLGGVLGKGVYFDGNNDFAVSLFPTPTQNNWYVGAWFDSREFFDNILRTKFYFADGSWIGMSRSLIMTYNPWVAPSESVRLVDIKNLGLQKEKYYHFGVKIFTENNQRRLSFYINGSPIKLPILGNTINSHQVVYSKVANSFGELGFNFKSGPNGIPNKSFFVLGDPGPNYQAGSLSFVRNPFKGWIDELRVYALSANEIRSDDYFEEFICNMALGTLVRLSNQETDVRLIPLIEKANKHQIFEGNNSLNLIVTKPPKGGTGITPIPIRPSALDLIKSVSGPKVITPSVNKPSRIQKTNVVTPITRGPASTGRAMTGLSFSSLKDRKHATVCEQMKLHSYVPINDFPDQKGGFCIDKVHRNQVKLAGSSASCHRKKQLKIDKLKLEATKPRPSFAHVPFCLSCHHQEASTEGFHVDALTAGIGQRQHDPRRQPLDWSKKHFGCSPIGTPYSYQSWNSPGRCSQSSYMMDAIFDYHPKITP